MNQVPSSQSVSTNSKGRSKAPHFTTGSGVHTYDGSARHTQPHTHTHTYVRTPGAGVLLHYTAAVCICVVCMALLFLNLTTAVVMCRDNNRHQNFPGIFPLAFRQKA